MAKMTIFPNGFSSWAETHFEVIAEITRTWDEDDRELGQKPRNRVERVQDEQGRGGLYELAEELTIKFEQKNKGKAWDGEFFDAIEEFLKTELA
jgi:hypothetical protein